VKIEREGPSIARLTAWLARQAELALGEKELSLPQYRVLALLADGMALPSSMADSLDVRRPSITAVVDGLVARRFVVREPDPTDRRKVSHSITAAGRRALQAADRDVEARLRAIAGSLGDSDRAADLVAGLEAWDPALHAWRAQRRTEPEPGRTADSQRRTEPEPERTAQPGRRAAPVRGQGDVLPAEPRRRAQVLS
jgi:long-chain acyl-CoA synthetase